MKRTLIGFTIVAAAAFAPPAFAVKADYCAAYARDFADAKAQDKTLWQHKYDIANEACLAEPKASAQVIKARPLSKKSTMKPQIAVPAEPQTTPASTSTKLKLEPRSENWNTYCANKYTSFNPKTGTYTSRTGIERKCIVSYP
jgi:BA14K-like protein